MAVTQHMHGHTAHEQGAQPAASMRCHGNHVAVLLACRPPNRGARVTRNSNLRLHVKPRGAHQQRDIVEVVLRFSLLVVFLFVVIIVCGMMIALHAKDRFGLLLGSGIVSLLALQAAVNIGVTTSLLPNKGLPLPFISYGGSNLVTCLFGVGLLLSIYRQGVLEPVNYKRTMIQARITPRI